MPSFCVMTFWRLEDYYCIMTGIINKLNLKMNQNTLIFLISMIGISISEYFHLCTLYYCSLIVGGASIVSVLLCLYAYTKNYMRNKSNSNKNQDHEK